MKNIDMTLVVVLSLSLAGLSCAIALVVLGYGFRVQGGGVFQLVHNLEQWINTTGFHLAYILLAVAGVVYLAKKP